MEQPKTQYKLQLDLQCGVCAALVAVSPAFEEGFQAGQLGQAPRFCARCAASMERYCLRCQRRAPMFFEEFWPDERQCVRTYSPAKHCPHCKAALQEPSAGGADGLII